MGQPKRVLCIMDMAGVGRAGMAAVLPVLAACGVQGCPLPTMLLSTHTGGFEPPGKLDTSGMAQKALEDYRRQEIEFDAVYVGYLASDDQIAVALEAMRLWPGAYKIVDPPLADNGVLYAGITPQIVSGMKLLCNQADLITPNYTESALLLGEKPGEGVPAEEVVGGALAQLSNNGCYVLITSVPTENGMQIAGCGPAFSEPYRIPVPYVPQHYPGTGDIFTAAVIGGLLVSGLNAEAAAKKAADFVFRAAQATFEAGGEVRHGLWYEPFLPLLS